MISSILIFIAMFCCLVHYLFTNNKFSKIFAQIIPVMYLIVLSVNNYRSHGFSYSILHDSSFYVFIGRITLIIIALVTLELIIYAITPFGKAIDQYLAELKANKIKEYYALSFAAYLAGIIIVWMVYDWIF